MTTPEYPDWTPSEVVQNLQSLGLGKYGTVFLDNDINGEALVYLQDSHLKELGIKLIGHRLTLVNFINNLKTGKAPPSGRSSSRGQSSHSTPADDFSSKQQKRQPQIQQQIQQQVQQQIQEEEPTPSWAQRRLQQQQQQQQYQQQQQEDDTPSYRIARKPPLDNDNNNYRIARKTPQQEDDNSARRRGYNQDSDSDNSSFKQASDWEQKRRQMQMRQYQQQQQQQQQQEPVRKVPSADRFQGRQGGFNDTTTKKQDPYSRMAGGRSKGGYNDDDYNDFDEEENPFASRPKLRGNPMSSPAVKTAPRTIDNDDDYSDDEVDNVYSRPQQQRMNQRDSMRDNQRDNQDYYGRQPARKTPSRQTPGRYGQDNIMDDEPPKQQNRRQPFRASQPQYDDEDDDSNEDDDDGGMDDDMDDYPPPPQQMRRQVPPSQMRQQQQMQMQGGGMSGPSGGSNEPVERRQCRYCGRKFAIDRIDKHEQICSKTANKKTRVFDARKMRIGGTDAAAYANKIDQQPDPKPRRDGIAKYKLEHQKLVADLRAARQYTEYENRKAEGKAVGPPPQAPRFEIEDDREPCPYCGRKFAAEAAKRHIPVCERMNGGRAKVGVQPTNNRRNIRKK